MLNFLKKLPLWAYLYLVYPVLYVAILPAVLAEKLLKFLAGKQYDMVELILAGILLVLSIVLTLVSLPAAAATALWVTTYALSYFFIASFSNQIAELLKEKAKYELIALKIDNNITAQEQAAPTSKTWLRVKQGIGSAMMLIGAAGIILPFLVHMTASLLGKTIKDKRMRTFVICLGILGAALLAAGIPALIVGFFPLAAAITLTAVGGALLYISIGTYTFFNGSEIYSRAEEELEALAKEQKSTERLFEKDNKENPVASGFGSDPSSTPGNSSASYQPVLTSGQSSQVKVVSAQQNASIPSLSGGHPVMS